ncbi:MAG TPA: diacylglycerol kinase family protein [Thermoanaerobaculia bacterium]|jgi:diacylglycerol kinase (ATP)
MKTRIIVNPNAGSVGEIETLQETLGKLPETEVRFTRKEGDARRLARQAVSSGAELIVAAGGDGTLNEVVNGMAVDFGGARLGLLPLGTGNDFARSIDVPADLEGALAVLAQGRTRAVDVARARFGRKRRHFINMSAGGFSGIVSEKAGEAKDRWGPLAYLRAALGSLPELKGFSAHLELDGSERLDVETYNVVISNGRYVAAGIPVAPQSELDDGRLDLMLVPTATIPQLARLVPQILLGRHTGSDLLLFRRARRIEIVSDPPMSFNVDGEVIGDEPALFEVLPRALEVVVGEEEGT